MTWTNRGGQATVIPPNTKHRIEYWVNQEQNKVIYTWYNAYGGTIRIVEWDYSDRLEDADGVLNEIRGLLGRDKKVKSYAGMSVGQVKERIEARDVPRDDSTFDFALQRTYDMYPELPRA